MKTAALAILALVGCSLSALSAPGTITATLTPPGPFTVGEVFTVTLAISGYTNATPIDGYQCRITYPAALLAFVGPFEQGETAPGAGQQWLARPGQESLAAGYGPVAAHNTAVPGTIIIDYTDLGYSDPEGGTTAAAGFIVSFPMRTLAHGSGSITPAAPAGGVTFFDTDLNNAGSPAFAGVNFTIGAALTPIEIWRLAHFGTTANAGNAHNDADPEKDGLVNRLEFAFGLNPNRGDPAGLPVWTTSGGTFTVQFPTPPGVGGVTYGAEYSTTLAAGSWVPLPDMGPPPLHSFTLLAPPGPRALVRLTVTGP